MQPIRKTILALDLGTSSVGWALFYSDEELAPTELIDLGVRHFEEVTEPKTGALKNAKRRAMRGMRKNLRRRRQRLDNLLGLLQKNGLASLAEAPFGTSEPDPHEPYRLRATAVEEVLSLPELRGAIYHLGRRRGFKSNRGAKLASLQQDEEVAAMLRSSKEDEDEESGVTAEEKKEEGKVLAEIETLRTALHGRTLGQYFYQEIQEGRAVRGRHTDRAMYEAEFEAIWDRQAQAYPNVLTPELKARIYHAIFYQRPLKRQKFLKAPCTLEPTKKRAEKGSMIAQEFRYWQDLANLLVTDLSTGERRALTVEERRRLAEKLEGQREMSWSAVKNELGYPKNARVEFNLERAKGGKLKGNTTIASIKKRAPAFWETLSVSDRETLVEMLLTVDDRGKLYQALRRKFGIGVEDAYQLATLELEAGTAGLSAKAMKRILVRMKEEGLSRSDAQCKAGYRPWEQEKAVLPTLPPVPDRKAIPNPRVRKGLSQVRKVVNAIIREYGGPAVVRLEMARDLSLTKKEKEGREKANKALEKENQEADALLKKIGIQNPTRADRTWYRLGKQANWRCPYTGRCIEQSKAAMGEFQIEHIVPYSRSLDDSFNNLTLCHAEANRKKGNRTPYEAFGGTPEWEGMVARVSEWKGFGTGHKRRLFLQQEWVEDEGFLSRQLNETRWITREAAKYLEPICDSVEVTKGQATAMIRRHWRLLEALYGEQGDADASKRNDLRHHAVDAVASAFTTRSLFMKLTAERKRLAASSGPMAGRVEPLSGDTVPAKPEWLHRALVKALPQVVVSHEPTRGISDAFHQETALGLVDPEKGIYHFRKPIAALSAGEIERIKDSALREAVREAVAAVGGDAKKLGDGVMVHGRRVKRARITVVKNKAPMIHTERGSFELGNNHHVEIFEHEANGKRIGRFVTTLEAARRVRIEKRPMVDTTPPAPGYRFVMWLCPNDCVQVEDERFPIYRVESLWAAQGNLQFRQINAADASDKEDRLFKTPGSLQATKLSVSAIGRIRELPEGIV